MAHGPALRRRTRADREAAEAALSPAATRSAGSAGRARPEPADPDRTCFEQDRDRILHSKAFRRLKHKTQVFIDPAGDHVVTRLTHTLQVAQVARSLAAGLALNEPLAEAIALGHDVGHTPFGHAGEDALATFFPDGWLHSAQSVRIYDLLEPRNLTAEVRDGILRHPWKVEPPPATPEARCVRYADRIAYLTHDVLDAVRAGVLDRRDLPGAALTALGPPGGRWIGLLVEAVLDRSAQVGDVEMDPALLPVLHDLRAFMFERVYHSPDQRRRTAEARRVVTDLVGHLLDHPELLPATYADPAADPLVRAADHVAGMTDRYAAAVHARWSAGRPAEVPA
jgi:dGTPase